MSSTCEFDALMDHHTETVKHMATELAKAKAEGEQARGLRNDVRAAEQETDRLTAEMKQLRPELERLRALHDYLQKTMDATQFNALVEKAKLADEIPF